MLNNSKRFWTFAIILMAFPSFSVEEVVSRAVGGWFAVDAREVKDTTWEGGAIIGGETNVVLQSSPNAWGEAGGGTSATITWASTSGGSGTVAAETTADSVLWTPEARFGTNTLTYVSGAVAKTATFVVKVITPGGVESVSARQRYPWNGLVDLSFTVTGEPGEQYDVSFAATNVVGGTNLTMKTLLDEKGAVLTSNAVKPGIYRWAWNAAADLPDGFKCDRVTVTAMAEEHLGGVQLWEGGPYWAECNVGATKPEEYGYYFWWGDTVGYKRNAANDGWVSVKDGTGFSFSSDNCPTYWKYNSTLLSAGYIDSAGNLVAEHDAAAAHLGSSWRMPTDAECDALISNCDTIWTTRCGVYGRLVTGRGEYASRSLFLPAAGYGYESNFYCAGLDGVGCYYSSSPNSGDSTSAWSIKFQPESLYRGDNGRCLGQSVRPVRDSAK